MAWAPKNFSFLFLDQSQRDQFVERFPNLGDQRASGHRANDVVRKPPAELLGNFVADGLGAFGVIGAQVHVHESPAVFLRDLRAQAVHLIIIAGNAHQFRAEDLCPCNFRGLEIGGNKDPRVETFACGLGGDGIGQVSGRRAAYDLKSEPARRGQGGGHDAIFKRKRRETNRVVFQVQIFCVQPFAEAGAHAPAA